jgi:hypothetical protein
MGIGVEWILEMSHGEGSASEVRPKLRKDYSE